MPNPEKKLPFLGTLSLFLLNRFATELYMKPIHSQSITPWDGIVTGLSVYSV